MKLYELTDQYTKVLENETWDKEAVQNALDDITDNIYEKVQEMARYIKNIESDIDSYKREIERLSDKEKTLENKKESIKEYITYQLIKADIKKVEGFFTVMLQANPPKVVCNGTVPDEYYIAQEPKLDTQRILQDLKNGKEIANAKLEQGQSLRIK